MSIKDVSTLVGLPLQPAVDAVRFQDFFQHATVNADDMADALHKALILPTQTGDFTTHAIDLALTQARLSRLVEVYVSAGFRQEAGGLVAQFIDEKATQADQATKVVLAQAAKLAQSLGDCEQAGHHVAAAAQLAEGTHASQVVRNTLLALTASTSDSEIWFATINEMVNKNRSPAWIVDTEKNHVSVVMEQWQAFVDTLKT